LEKIFYSNARVYAIRAFIYELLQRADSQVTSEVEKALELDKNVGSGRYTGIIEAKDSFHTLRSQMFIRVSHQIERDAMTKYLLWVEFSKKSLLEAANITEEITREFVKNRFIVLRKVIPKYILDTQKKCIDSYIKNNLVTFGDSQSKKRYVQYSDRCSRFLHFALIDVVRKVTMNNVIPTYTYFGGYVEGASLDPHTDRLACEFTLSLTHYQVPQDKPWNLCLGRRALFDFDVDLENPESSGILPPENEQVEANLYEGDALLLMGRQLVHWRKGVLQKGEETHNSFLHYVNSKFIEQIPQHRKLENANILD